MICPTCATHNPAGSRFCMECGTRLPASEPAQAGSPVRAQADSEATAVPTVSDGDVNSSRGASAVDLGSATGGGPAQATSVRNLAELPATHPEWRMSPAGPLPDQPRRRWVVWVVGALGVCLLLCVAIVVWSSTAGRGTLDAIATQVTLEATRQSQGQ